MGACPEAPQRWNQDRATDEPSPSFLLRVCDYFVRSDGLGEQEVAAAI